MNEEMKKRIIAYLENSDNMSEKEKKEKIGEIIKDSFIDRLKNADLSELLNSDETDDASENFKDLGKVLCQIEAAKFACSNILNSLPVSRAAELGNITHLIILETLLAASQGDEEELKERQVMLKKTFGAIENFLADGIKRLTKDKE